MTRALIRIATLFQKDLRDAIRDMRVLIALVVPIGIALLYNYTFDDSASDAIKGKLVYSAADQSALPTLIQQALPPNMTVTFVPLPDRAAVEKIMADEDASLGLVIPAGFDAALKSGVNPPLTVIRSPGGSLAGDYILAALDPVVRAMAGQNFPATINLVQSSAEPKSMIDKVGARSWALVLAVMMMLFLVAALAIPIVLAEEFEKKTIDALVMAMPYREVIAAKAGLGLFYIAVMIVIFNLLTDLHVKNWPLFLTGVTLTSLALLGFGLLLAGTLKNANQLNNWSGVFLTPFIGPAVVVGQPVPSLFKTIANWLPSGAGMRLTLNGVSDQKVFDHEARSIAILIGWTLLSNLLLLWQLKRRQA